MTNTSFGMPPGGGSQHSNLPKTLPPFFSYREETIIRKF